MTALYDKWHFKYLYSDMGVEDWFVTQLNNNIYEQTAVKWKYYIEMKASQNFVQMYDVSGRS